MPAACDNMATRSKGCAPDLTQLPPVTNLQHMSKREMQAFITKMLQCVTGKKNPGYGLESARPEWWPEQVPWVDINKDGKIDRLQLSLTDALRNVIVHCYLYHGRQDLLCLGPNVQVVTKPNGALSFLGGEKGHTLGDSRNTQFADPSLTSASAYIPVPGDSPARNTRSTSLSEDHRDKTFVEVFICFHCEKEYCSKTELLNHQNICEQRPSSFHQQLQTPPHKMLRNRHIPELTPLKIVQRRESGKRPPKDKFLSGLGLLPQYKAEELKKKKKDIVIDDKALEVEEPQTPRSPTTPRTPKSLLSQLTREPPDTPHTPHTPSWRRLSVCKEDRPADLESVSDASSDISEADERQSGYMGRGNLLTIDVSSPLGKRVKRLVQPGSEGTGSVILDYNRFCHTPTKSAVMGKLRERNANFPITFKKTRRTNPKYYHMYTFSTRQRREQYKRLVTGLDKRGRKLARSLPKCKVVLQRLKKEDIKKWVKPVKVPVIDLKPLSTTEIALWVKTPDKDAVPKMNGTSPRDGWLAAARLPPGELDVAFREPGVHVYRSLLSELEGGSGSRGRIGNSISRGHLIVHPTSTNQEKSSGSKVGQCRSRSQSPNKSPQNKLPTLASLLDKSPAPVTSGEYFSQTCQVPNNRITSHGSPGGKFPQHVSANNNKDLVQRTSKRTCPSSRKAVAVGTQTNSSPKQISIWEEPCPRFTRRRSASSSSDSSSSSIIVLEDIPVVAAPHAGGTNTEVDQTLSESDWSLEICSVDSESSFSQEPQRRNQRSSTRGISRSEKLKQKSRDPSPCKTHRSGSAAVSSSVHQSSKGTITAEQGRNVQQQSKATGNQQWRPLRSNKRTMEGVGRGRKSSSSSSCSEMSVDSEISFRISREDMNSVMDGIPLSSSHWGSGGRTRQNRSLDPETVAFHEPLTISLSSSPESTETFKSKQSPVHSNQHAKKTSEKNDDKDSGITISSSASHRRTRSWTHSPTSSTGSTASKRKLHESVRQNGKSTRLEADGSSLRLDKPNFWEAIENWKCSLEGDSSDMCIEWVSSARQDRRESKGSNRRKDNEGRLKTRSSLSRVNKVTGIQQKQGPPRTGRVTSSALRKKLQSKSGNKHWMRFSKQNSNNNNSNSRGYTRTSDGKVKVNFGGQGQRISPLVSAEEDGEITSDSSTEEELVLYEEVIYLD